MYKKTIGKNLGNFLSTMSYNGNNEYIELQKQISEIKQRTQNIDKLTKIVDTMEKDDSFAGIKKDLREFHEEFLKQIQKEKDIKNVQQSRILDDLKNIKKLIKKGL